MRTLQEDDMASKKQELKQCQAARSDGECSHPDCPQRRDGEPQRSGRTCPLPWWTGDDEDGLGEVEPAR